MASPDYILQQIDNKRIIILGFGKEGVSTYRFIRKHFPDMPLVIADGNANLNTNEIQDPHVRFIKGEGYDRNLNDYDLIFKTPGVNFNKLGYLVETARITSQTNLFLEAFHRQVIGITGTKGKSTTASLIYHLLKSAGRDTLLAGNIGVPFFDIIDNINHDTAIVAELSAHQLEFVHCSPDTAVLLNLFQEHLDHFISFNDYQLAKMNITKFQSYENFLVYNGDDEHIPELMKRFDFNRTRCIFGARRYNGLTACCQNGIVRFSDSGTLLDEYDLREYHNLPGTHNFYNIMAAVAVCRHEGVSHAEIMAGLQTFRGLPNRIEFVGTFNGIRFYNDSISTIPEATMAAVETLRKVDTLILGGFDRGIDYRKLVLFLHQNPIAHIAFTGPAGRRIFKEWNAQFPVPDDYIIEDDFRRIIDYAFEKTAPNRIVLLSPAAASYDQFKNFEERGRIFKQYIQEKSSHYA